MLGCGAQRYISKLTNSESLDIIKENFIYFVGIAVTPIYYKLHYKILTNAIKEAKTRIIVRS